MSFLLTAVEILILSTFLAVICMCIRIEFEVDSWWVKGFCAFTQLVLAVCGVVLVVNWWFV